MRTFVLRARAAPTDPHKLLAGVGGEVHAEILAHALMNAFLIAQSHRDDVVAYLVLESTADFSRTLRFEGGAISGLGGFHEQAWLAKIAKALEASRGMGKDERRVVEPGLEVRTQSFERLVAELAPDHALFVMDRKGAPIAEALADTRADIRGNTRAGGSAATPAQGLAAIARPCFILTDHIPMPKNSLSGLERLGARKISLGKTMLFASQCVVLIHHALDMRE
ncbi:MAG TPA: tRNA (pseudouridine(54)-N(1))-methyltransferase TrmY [Xanthomonadaceae bacterium]|jgi:tRNA (pseudouridine54-N1)-methyltransferase|nr:tRNA (pseudouridine(54)-N(1))-methyltransferase TrmY [Xanthomonadaceae bacterium]